MQTLEKFFSDGEGFSKKKERGKENE